MEFITIQKNISDSPRKLRLVANMIRKMDPYAALDTLHFTKNAASEPLAKAIKTVIANAGSKEGLIFKSIEINEALKMRRYRVGTAGRGRGRPYKKRMSHIRIILTDDAAFKPVKGKKVTAKAVIPSQGEGSVKAKPVVQDKIVEIVEKDMKIEEKKEGAK